MSNNRLGLELFQLYNNTLDIERFMFLLSQDCRYLTYNIIIIIIFCESLFNYKNTFAFDSINTKLAPVLWMYYNIIVENFLAYINNIV